MTTVTVTVPLSSLARVIEEAEGNQFRSVLKTLRSKDYINQSLLKSDIGVFVAKVLKLLRSNDPYQVWKGCHAVTVLCTYNPVVLCAQANQFLTVLYTRMESFVTYYNETCQSKPRLTALRTLTKTIDSLIDLIRGKPTLTREALTPKLNAIIPILITLSQYEPDLSLPMLKKMLLENTTTFRPFANKYRVILNRMISKDFQLYSKHTQKLICDNFAYLHLIKQSAQKQDENQEHHKAFMDEHWRAGISAILFQFKPLIQLCGDMVDFTADPELVKLIESLPTDKSGKEVKDELFAPLFVDLNESFTLYEISYRVEVLSQLLISFISLPTPFPIRVPINSIVNVSQALLMLCLNYLPLKRGLRRESELTAVIISVLRSLQYQGITILKTVTKYYGKEIFYFCSSILSSIELFIPMKTRSHTVDYVKVETMKEEIFDVLSLINQMSNRLGHKIDEIDLFAKLVDITLRLLEDKSNLDEFHSNMSDNKNMKQTTKQKKDFNKVAGAMSDIYSHPNKFISKTENKWFDEANEFFCLVVNNWKLPSAQQINITKYATFTSLRLKERLGKIPASFSKLLTTLVLHPGNERIAILPIAINLLKDDDNEVLDVFCNPRMPFTAVLSAAAVEIDKRMELKMPNDEDEEEEEVNVTTQDVKLELGAGRESETRTESPKNEDNTAPVLPENTVQTIVTDQSQIFKKRSTDEIEVCEQEDTKRTKTKDQESVELLKNNSTGLPNVVESKSLAVNTVQDSDSDSEIEIPTLNVSDNDDEEDDEE